MKAKLITALVLSIGLGSAAFAQSDTDDQGQSPDVTWDETLTPTFFSEDAGALLPAEEVQVNWDGLTEEQQAQVRDYCASADLSTEPEGAEPAGIADLCEWVGSM